MSVIPLTITAHIQNKGDVTFSKAQELAGTRGKQLAVEGFSISCPCGVDLEYMACLVGKGDTHRVRSPQFVGTRGQTRKMEGFAIYLVGPCANQYDVKYYAHLSGSGDSPVVANGTFVGARGQGRAVEGLAVWLEPKVGGYSYPPVNNVSPFPAPYPSQTPYSPPGYPPQNNAYPSYPPQSTPAYPSYPPQNTSYPPTNGGYPSPPTPYGHPSPYVPVSYPSVPAPMHVPMPMPMPMPVTMPSVSISFSHGQAHGHGHGHGQHKLSGKYMITCSANGKALDGNTGACSDKNHPRVFLWNSNPHARNHQWELRHVEKDYYMIVNCFSNLAIDGNEDIHQHQHGYPTPFLWNPTPSAKNHQWMFVPVGGSYVIINRHSGKALDGNYTGCSQASHSHPNPFLWSPNHSAPNHQWKLHKI